MSFGDQTFAGVHLQETGKSHPISRRASNLDQLFVQPMPFLTSLSTVNPVIESLTVLAGQFAQVEATVRIQDPAPSVLNPLAMTGMLSWLVRRQL